MTTQSTSEVTMPSDLALTVVVVSYNSAAFLARCLTPIIDQASTVAGVQVIVTDNASHDGSAEYVRSHFPGVEVIASATNLGFGAGCNLAFTRAQGRHLLLVNPDCEIDPGTLRQVVTFLDAHRDVAVVGGRLRYGDGSFQESAFRFPSLAQIFFDFFPIHWRLTRSRMNGRYPRMINPAPFPCDAVLGALMAVRREAYVATGGFDPRYFMYVEEIDWCHRLQMMGLQTWHVPSITAIHHGGQSTKKMAGPMFLALHRSRLRYYHRFWSPPRTILARAITWVGCWSRVASLRRHPSPDTATMIQACHDVMRMVTYDDA